MCSLKDGKSRKDERLPLRWGVILAVAAGTGWEVAALGGTWAGIGVGTAVVGLLSQILGN